MKHSKSSIRSYQLHHAHRTVMSDAPAERPQTVPQRQGVYSTERFHKTSPNGITVPLEFRRRVAELHPEAAPEMAPPPKPGCMTFLSSRGGFL